MRNDPVDVTSIHRPDTSWRQIDARGHHHRWFVGDQPAGEYRPLDRHTTPTLTWVVDGTRVDEDGEEYEYGHSECVQCGEHVKPAYTSDTYSQFIPGLTRYFVDGKEVDRETFIRAYESIKGKLPVPPVPDDDGGIQKRGI